MTWLARLFGSSCVATLAAALLGALAPAVNADDWPRFLGPNIDGISAEKGWALWTGAAPKILWKKSLGLGCSSVAVSNGKLYTMGNVAEKDVVYCLNPDTGDELWKISYPCSTNPKYFEGGTRMTPTVDGDRVYTLSQEGLLLCLDTTKKGERIWEKKLTDLGGQVPEWGYSAAPTVIGDNLIVEVGAPGGSTMAFNKRTGAVVWKSGDEDLSYSTPVPATFDGKKTILVAKAKVILGLNRDDGKELWRFDFTNSPGINIAVPLVVDANRLFISTGYNTGCKMVEIKGGEVKTLFQNRDLATQVNPAVLFEGHAIGFSGNSGARPNLVCMNLADGKVAWKQPDLGANGLTLSDGKLILLSEQSELIIAPASIKEFKPLARYKVFGEDRHTFVVPVLANGRIYCRENTSDLACVDVRGR